MMDGTYRTRGVKGVGTRQLFLAVRLKEAAAVRSGAVAGLGHASATTPSYALHSITTTTVHRNDHIIPTNSLLTTRVDGRISLSFPQLSTTRP